MTLTNGLVVMTPTSVSYAGTSASINADGSVVFSACVELILDGVFTSDYDNYMVTYRGNATGNCNLYLRFRQSGSDNNSNTQVVQSLLSYSTTIYAARSSAAVNGVFLSSAVLNSGGTGFIFGPHLAQPTAYRTTTANGSDSLARTDDEAATESSSTQWDGFKIQPNAFNFSGRITVFGFNQ
jgi:hypothetical protein